MHDMSVDVFFRRKSLVKPVTWQKTCDYIELFGSFTQDLHARRCIYRRTFIKWVVHDDLGWKNQTTRYILPRHWLYKWFSVSLLWNFFGSFTEPFNYRLSTFHFFSISTDVWVTVSLPVSIPSVFWYCWLGDRKGVDLWNILHQQSSQVRNNTNTKITESL